MKKEIINKIIKYLLWMAAVYAVTLTGFAFKLAEGNYIHIGDIVVYLSALFLPTPVAVFVSSAGCALADVTLGASNYILATIVVKALVVVAAKMFIKLSDKVLVQDILICFCGAVMVAGYYVADVIMLLIQKNGFIESMQKSIDFLRQNVLQALVCAVIYIVISGIARKIKDNKTEQNQ